MLKNRLKETLKELDDRSQLSDCAVFYRPSFGRGGSNTANFGEFDAIISTNTHVYLVESKWEGAGRSSDWIVISDAQLDRHAIFGEYFAKWDRSIGIPSLTTSASGFLKGVKKKIVSEKDELAKHLQFVFSRIADRSDTGDRKHLQNVLLFFHRQDVEPRPRLEPKGFGRVISVKCPISIDLVGDSWFFEMGTLP